MNIYKLTIRPLASFRTPLQSDTIFGHLMWALRYTEGEDALVTFLDRYRNGEPPLLVSAGFPEGTLPTPALPLAPGERLAPYLPLEQWHVLAGGLSRDTLRQAHRAAQDRRSGLWEGGQEHPVTRTAVDRITGSAREGRLFVSMETFYAPGCKFDVWHKVDEGDVKLPGRLSTWWRWVERNGFGRGKSTGHGAFNIVEPLHPAPGELPEVAHPNGFVTLSAWVPRRGEPTDVTYRTRIKRGKLGEALAIPSPWKKPLLMLKPGAVARLDKEDGEVHKWYGRLVEDVHWTEKGIVQYGYAFPLPVHIEKGA
jgi:CRISPR-associated protein Csm4